VSSNKRNVDPNQGHISPPGLGIKRGDSPGGEPSINGGVRDTTLSGRSNMPGKR
jgi:hypothetical protein